VTEGLTEKRSSAPEGGQEPGASRPRPIAGQSSTVFPSDVEVALERADQSVSVRFTRVMNATTSRFGVLTDPSVVGLATAPVAVGLLAALRLEAAPSALLALEILVAVPLGIGVATALSLTSARGRVVRWLADQPFPIENVNALLNGLGEALEVTFREAAPDAKSLNAALDRVSPECFVGRTVEDTGDARVVELRIGVVDSKRNPSASNHQRFERVVALVNDVLRPLSATSPIAEVRIK
jgi:hypothetical protein